MAEAAKSAATNRQLLPLARCEARALSRSAQIHLHAPSAAVGPTYVNSRSSKPADVAPPPLRRNAACLENRFTTNREVN
jgi:hypothetical protein